MPIELQRYAIWLVRYTKKESSSFNENKIGKK
jgi:hypothetical protein